MKGNNTGGSNVASEASYWCNRRETSEIEARAYTGQREGCDTSGNPVRSGRNQLEIIGNHGNLARNQKSGP